jgi:hypothetical protein
VVELEEQEEKEFLLHSSALEVFLELNKSNELWELNSSKLVPLNPGISLKLLSNKPRNVLTMFTLKWLKLSWNLLRN